MRLRKEGIRMQFSFSKWHGCGNDFVLVDGSKYTFPDNAQAAIAVCDRHFGIGADGLVLLLPSQEADFEMRIFNSDGSEAEMCGNVTRCMARFAYENGLTDKKEMTFKTKAGLIRPKLLADGQVRVDMGEPKLAAQDIPVKDGGEERIVSRSLQTEHGDFAVTCVSMGNPHAVIFVDDAESLPLELWGPKLETHPFFPRKTNVEFVQVINRQALRMRVWERGAGVTLACGTGSCATVTAAVLNGLAERRCKVALDGGVLEVEWAEKDNHVYLTGPATEVFRGTCRLRGQEAVQ